MVFLGAAGDNLGIPATGDVVAFAGGWLANTGHAAIGLVMLAAYQDDRRDDRRVGFLRYNYFWDDEPFMNLLWVEEDLRSKGFGTQLISFWEKEMPKLGYNSALTSTLSNNEGAQRLYRRLGYGDSGCLLMPGEPLEILLLKRLSQETREPSRTHLNDLASDRGPTAICRPFFGQV